MCIFQILIHSLPTISCHFTVTVNVCLGKVGLLSISIAWTKSESIQKGHRSMQNWGINTKQWYVLFSLQQCLRTYDTEPRKTCFAMYALNYYWILSPFPSRSKSHQSKSKKITTVEPESRVSWKEHWKEAEVIVTNIHTMTRTQKWQALLIQPTATSLRKVNK